MLLGSPCDPGPHFSFLPSALSTQEACLGPPLPILSAASGHGVLASPATTPGLLLPVLCKMRHPPCGMGRLLRQMGGQVNGGPSQAGSLPIFPTSRPLWALAPSSSYFPQV